MDNKTSLLNPPRRFPASVPGFLTPPVLWAVYFVFIYSVHGIGCDGLDQAFGEPGGVSGIRLIVGVATLAALVIHLIVGLLAFRVWKKIRRAMSESRAAQSETESGPNQTYFLAYAALLNAALFAVATVWIGVPTLLLQPCV